MEIIIIKIVGRLAKLDKITRRIITNTGRMPVSCNCELCQAQCKRCPCLGTPQDILALINAGYKDKLALTIWEVGYVLGELDYGIPMVQIKQTPNGCVFFDNGLCQLHDKGLKPTEGRLSYHTITKENTVFSKTLSYNVAKEWTNPENDAIIYEVMMKMR